MVCDVTTHTTALGSSVQPEHVVRAMSVSNGDACSSGVTKWHKTYMCRSKFPTPPSYAFFTRLTQSNSPLHSLMKIPYHTYCSPHLLYLASLLLVRVLVHGLGMCLSAVAHKSYYWYPLMREGMASWHEIEYKYDKCKNTCRKVRKGTVSVFMAHQVSVPSSSTPALA